MVYLSIFAVLLGLASISFFDSSLRYKLQRAVWEIRTQMNYARYKAVLKRTRFRLCFAEDGYVVERYDRAEKNWALDRANYLERVQIHANNSPVFHPQGTVSNLASITVSNASGGYKITLAISGRIKVTPL